MWRKLHRRGEARNEFVVVRQRYREKHPKYILAAASLDGLKQQLAATVLKVRTRIQESLRIAYENALTSQHGLEAQLHETETNAMQLSDVAVISISPAGSESDKAQFDSIISRPRRDKGEAQITPEKIRIIQPALVPEWPASPKVKLIFALAVFGGLAVGLGISFVLDSINTTFRTVDEAEHFWAAGSGRDPRMAKRQSGKHEIGGGRGFQFPRGGGLSHVARNALHAGTRKRPQDVSFTSSLPSEGKTFTSLNYSVSLAQQGLRTLLVDIDLRRPMVEEFFTGKRRKLPGITDYFWGARNSASFACNTRTFPNYFGCRAAATCPTRRNC